MENMAEILPERSKQEINKLTRHYFHHLFLTFYEILVDSLRLCDSAMDRFRVQGEEHLEAALQKGKGAIIYSPHTGNFFYYYWYLTRKYNCITVATGGSPELRPLYLIFQHMGCNGLDYDHTPPLVLYRTLREHLKQNGVVFLLGDFYRPNFPEAILFQRKTRLPSGAASLALELGAPIIPFYGYRSKRMGHELVFLPPIDLAEKFHRNQRDEAMRLLHQVMENLILAKPEQWFYWFDNERWGRNKH
jgi:KDO2-lipid IV(A) lauroyltransferase